MDQPNIILIVLDTLRKDVLSMYGGNAYTPNLDEFVKDSVIFPNAIATSPWTVPSHTSFFTGKYAIEHSVHEDKMIFTHNINEKLVDLPDKFIWEILIDKGYNALSFSANGFISPDSGYNRSWNYIKSYYEYYKIQDELNIKEAKTYGNNLQNLRSCLSFLIVSFIDLWRKRTRYRFD